MSMGCQGFCTPFLPTPSARRATHKPECVQNGGLFLPTPSARRATCVNGVSGVLYTISTHALREEGDAQARMRPKWGIISTHALREEGDWAAMAAPGHDGISTHALREEGDLHCFLTCSSPRGYFYPRPPRGGRRHRYGHHQHRGNISTHALREEGDVQCPRAPVRF